MKLIHVGILVSDLERSAAFYEEVLQLEPALRPDLGFPGIFYALDGGGQIHLMQLPNPYAGCELPAHGGRDRHIALGVADVEALASRLDAAAIQYARSRSGRAAIFCRDPDGNTIELMQV